MPAFSPTGQPAPPRAPELSAWFAAQAGRVLLDSEAQAVARALAARPGLPWLWLSPCVQHAPVVEGRGVRLVRAEGERWAGDVVCGPRLPLPSDVFAAIIVQHALTPQHAGLMLPELARLLVPGGHLWLFALNPLSPWRWHWRGSGLSAVEPFRWRRALRRAGLLPDPVSRGIGPIFRRVADSAQQTSAGLRAAYVLHAEKRHTPLTPIRSAQRVPLNQGLPAI